MTTVASNAKPNATIGRKDTLNNVYNPPNAPNDRDKLAEPVVLGFFFMSSPINGTLSLSMSRDSRIFRLCCLFLTLTSHEKATATRLEGLVIDQIFGVMKL